MQMSTSSHLKTFSGKIESKVRKHIIVKQTNNNVCYNADIAEDELREQSGQKN